MGSRKCPELPRLHPEYILIGGGEGRGHQSELGRGREGGQAWRALQSFPEREPCKAPGMKRLMKSGLPGFRVERMLLVQFQQSVIPCNFTSRGDNQACEIHHPRPL